MPFVNDMLRTGVTYRQLDYWTVKGWLHTTKNPTPGSGHQRRWDPGEEFVAARMLRLVRAGLAPDVAARVARGGEFAPGVRMLFDSEEGAA